MSKIEVNAIEPQCGTTLTVGASGDTILIPSGATINNQGSAVNFGPTGAVSWNTTKVTTGFTATAGVGYFADTTSSAFTITLPSSPAAGAVIGITDYANTFATNNLTIGRNGSNIGGIAANAILSTNGIAVTFVYVDATQGWIVTDSGNRSDLPTPQFVAATGGTICTSGDYKIHTFTGPGTFTVTSTGNPFGSATVDYLVVAGGGGGGRRYGGGGGAGGFRESKATGAPWTASPLASSTSLPVSATGYPITIGGGGAGGTSSPAVDATKGSDSIFSTITSSGGGAGAHQATPSNKNGGSGSGGSVAIDGANLPAGTGNTPPVAPPQGNSGGNAVNCAPKYGSGGGGGATAIGVNGTTTSGGNGGNGATTSITGSPVSYAGGGGGGTYDGGTIGTGGTGGGGNAGISGGGNGNVGTVNTGGGGGGASASSSVNYNGAAGGSGIVIIRYKFQ